MTGKANLEVRPRFVNKGEIAKRLVLEYGEAAPEFVLCLGDDFTDEGKKFSSRKARSQANECQTCSDRCDSPNCQQITSSQLLLAQAPSKHWPAGICLNPLMLSQSFRCSMAQLMQATLVLWQ